MPYISVHATTLPTKFICENLLKELTQKLSTHFGKPEMYIMATINTEVAMSFGGSSKPCCYVEIKNIGTMTPELTKAISKDVCTSLETTLKVPPERIYIEFQNQSADMWGWNKSTFG